MKFDPFSWHEVMANEKVQVGKGWLRLRCSAEAPLYIEAEGHEVLYGVGTAFDAEVSDAVSVRVEGKVRVFLHRPFGTSMEGEGETFTNIDRMVSESGNLFEVKKAMRAFQLEQRAMLGQIRAERDSLVAERAAAAQATVKPPVDPAPADPAPADPAPADPAPVKK